MNGYRYNLDEENSYLNQGSYYINKEERFLQKFYIKTIKLGGDDEFYMYRESNPFNKSMFGPKIFKMKGYKS